MHGPDMHRLSKSILFLRFRKVQVSLSRSVVIQGSRQVRVCLFCVSRLVAGTTVQLSGWQQELGTAPETFHRTGLPWFTRWDFRPTSHGLAWLRLRGRGLPSSLVSLVDRAQFLLHALIYSFSQDVRGAPCSAGTVLRAVCLAGPAPSQGASGQQLVPRPPCVRERRLASDGRGELGDSGPRLFLLFVSRGGV